MPNLVCESCGEGFWQGRGRPARRCGRCRSGDRYGAAHQALRARSHEAVGAVCTRCQTIILPGQPVEPDHLDGGGPHDYAGWAHASCNHKAGASRGNRMRAAAYRALQGAVVSAPATNGAAAVVREPPPERPECVRSREQIRAGNPPLACLCGKKNSRCW